MSVVQMRRPEYAPDTFDAFWAAYPYPGRQRSSKALTRQIWQQITTTGRECKIPLKDGGQVVSVEKVFVQATPQEILEGVKRYDQLMTKPGTGEYGYKDDGKFICGPAVFLNQARWEQ